MEQTWEEFKFQIAQWSMLQTSDQQFFDYLSTSCFGKIDQRLADIFIKQHDNGEWSHIIYHRQRVIPCDRS